MFGSRWAKPDAVKKESITRVPKKALREKAVFSMVEMRKLMKNKNLKRQLQIHIPKDTKRGPGVTNPGKIFKKNLFNHFCCRKVFAHHAMTARTRRRECSALRRLQKVRNRTFDPYYSHILLHNEYILLY